MYRLKGELWLLEDKDEIEADKCFQKSIHLAKQRQTRWWELRATVSLARLWKKQGKLQEARDKLKEIYEWFTEGFDTEDLKEAKSLLVALDLQIEEQSKPPSIAVLPFVNMSSDTEQEYFCDGITEEILNALGQVSHFKVIARTSAFFFKDQNLDIREIGEKLGVHHVLEGSVRKAGKRIRITAQLIKVKDRSHCWSKRYDRELEDIFEIQDEIATSIANQLQTKLFDPGLTKQTENYPSPDFQSYNLYLKGKHFWYRWSTEYDFQQSILCYKKSLTIDPRNAKAWSGLAVAYGTIGLGYWNYQPMDAYPKALHAALKAIELDPTLAEAHTHLGFIQYWFEFNWGAAEDTFKKAKELDPNLAAVYDWYGVLLSALGRAEEALRVSPTSLPTGSLICAAAK